MANKDEKIEEKVEEVKDDSQERVNSFVAEYGELVKKYNIDFSIVPV
jgi:hypothetical protein